MLKLGNRRPLTEEDLFYLPEDCKAEVLVEKAEKYWFEELRPSEIENKWHMMKNQNSLYFAQA